MYEIFNRFDSLIFNKINTLITPFYGENFKLSKEWALFEIVLTATTGILATIAIAVICLPVRIAIFILDALISFAIKPLAKKTWAAVVTKYREVRT